MYVALCSAIRVGSRMIVHDAWFATHAAINRLEPEMEYSEAPPVNHNAKFRTCETGNRHGWHSNDAEAEISLLRSFI